MCVHWISDLLTSTFKNSIILKLFRAGHWFFQWSLMILKSNFSKNFSTLGEFSKDLLAKEVTVRFFFLFFCHSYFVLWLKIDIVSMFCLQKLPGTLGSCARHPPTPTSEGGSLSILNNWSCFLYKVYTDWSKNLRVVSFERYLLGEIEIEI